MRCHYASWSASPDVAGPSKKLSKPAKAWPGWMNAQVRRWTSWRRWTLLAMIAHALLAVIAAHTRPPIGRDDQIALTCNEIRRLLTALIIEPARTIACTLTWSAWRRRHQYRAKTSHYQRRGYEPPTP